MLIQESRLAMKVMKEAMEAWRKELSSLLMCSHTNGCYK